MPIDRSIGNYHDSSNARIRKIGRVYGPVAYVAGGEPYTAADLGLGKIEAALVSPAINTAHTTVYILVPDSATMCLIWYDIGTGAEAVAGTDLSGYSARFEAIGY